MMRIAMLISGDGTTMRSIIEACRSGTLYRVRPVLVISSKQEAGGITKALAAGIAKKDIIVLVRKDFPCADDFGQAILKACYERGVDFIGQYGWMIKTPQNVIKAFPGMMVNQHPGPLDPGRPDFGGKGMFGLRVHCSRLLFVRETSSEPFTEATAQRVAVEYDRGAILHSRQIRINHDDTPESLQQRLLPEEHLVQIETLQMFAQGTVKEVIREKPLVATGQEKILEWVKNEAIKRYPNG